MMLNVIMIDLRLGSMTWATSRPEGDGPSLVLAWGSSGGAGRAEGHDRVWPPSRWATIGLGSAGCHDL
jgi:hypothetical protein